MLGSTASVAGVYEHHHTGRAAAEGFDVAARPLDWTRVMRMVQIGELPLLFNHQFSPTTLADTR